MSEHTDKSTPNDVSGENAEDDRSGSVLDYLKRIWRKYTNKFLPEHINLPVMPGWKKALLLFVVVLLAGIPSALVMANRWFGVMEREVVNPYWCKSDFLCRSALPSYFLIVFTCLALLLVVMIFVRKRTVVIREVPLEVVTMPGVSRNQSKAGLIYIILSVTGFVVLAGYSLYQQMLPGWNLVFLWLVFIAGCFLWSVPWGYVKTIIRQKAGRYTALLLLQLALILFLSGLYGNPEVIWLSAWLLVLAGINLWRYKNRVPPIYWIATLALIVFTYDLNGWWTAAVGDEYNFMTVAQEILAQPRIQDAGNLLFKAEGAHGTHPMFSSALHALSMVFLGNNNFGWRFSNPFLCMLSVVLFYLFCRSFIPNRLALLASFLMAVSSCLMSFSKIGYNNLQALFAMTLLLAAAVWAIRWRSLFTYACLGSVLAFCFYIYPAALYVIPLPLLLLAIYDFPRTRQKVALWLVMLLTMCALIFPLFMQPVYWAAKVPGTFYNQPEITRSTASMLYHVVSNLLYASFSYMFIVEESHYVAVSYLDPVTCGLFAIGFWLLIVQMRRQKFPQFILLSYVFYIFIIGVSHDRTHPPNTRMFLFIPLYALIAAWGVCWVWEQVNSLLPGRKHVSRVSAILFAVILTGVNLYQAYPLSHYRFAHQANFESLFIRVAQKLTNVDPHVTKTYAVIVNENWSVEGLLMMQKVYPELQYAKIEQVRITEPPVPDEYSMMFNDRNTYVFFFSGMDQSWFQPLDEQLRGFNKVPCEITTYTGDYRFTLYHHPDMPQGCYP